MSAWKLKTLGEICDAGGGRIQTGPFGSQLHESDYTDEGVPVVMPADIVGGQLDTRRIARIPEGKAYQLKRHFLKVGDIVYGRRGDIGRQAIIRKEHENWLCGTGCLKVSVGAKSAVSSTFLNRYLQSSDVIGWIQGQAIGATMPNLNTDILRRIPIYSPENIEEQKKIAAVLSAYDELIENNRRRIALLEKLAEELYREWFVRLRFPGHEKVKLVKGVPEGWTIEPLGGLVSDIIDYRGITPEKLGTQWSEEGITALSALNVKNGRLIKLDDTYKASDSLYERWMRKELQMHDILLTSEAPLGQVYMLMDSEKYILSQRLFALRANPARMEPCYLYHYLLGPIGQGQLAARATGSTVGGIRQQLLRQIEVIVPPSELQEAYRKLVLPILDQIHALTKATSALTRTRDLLLPRLISGKLRVEDLDIQFPPGMGD